MNNNFLSQPMGVKLAGPTTESSECDHKGSFLCTKDIKFAGKNHLAVKVASSKPTDLPKKDGAETQSNTE